MSNENEEATIKTKQALSRRILLRGASVAMALPLLAETSFSSQELKPEDIYPKVRKSVMTLTVDKKEGKTVGTAFLCIKDGIALTAWHVIKDAKHVTAKFPDGEEFEVSGLIDKDESRDIALIRVKVFGKILLNLKPNDPVVGSKAFVIGAPKGLEFSFSDGIISQIQTINKIKLFQFTCPVSPGNSGGPLLNSKGEVLGIVSWQLRDSQNLNFAVPSSYALGLDSSLPTQPWSSVKYDESDSSNKKPEELSIPKKIKLGKEDIEVSDTQEFFIYLFGSEDSSKLDKFESDEDYAERIRKNKSKFNTHNVYYVHANRKIGNHGQIDESMYDYDIKTEMLTIYSCLNHYIKNTDEGAPFCIKKTVPPPRDYQATNGFGAKITVTEYKSMGYYLNIANHRDFTDKYVDTKNHVIGMTVSVKDKEIARSMSKECKIVLGFSLIRVKKPDLDFDQSKATFNNPIAIEDTRMMINVFLERILLIDKNNNLISYKIRFSEAVNIDNTKKK